MQWQQLSSTTTTTSTTAAAEKVISQEFDFSKRCHLKNLKYFSYQSFWLRSYLQTVQFTATLMSFGWLRKKTGWGQCDQIGRFVGLWATF